MTRMAAWPPLLLVLTAALAGQGRTEIPTHLKLKGDPAAGLDLGSLRIVPVGRRAKDGKVTGAAYLCRTSLGQGGQTAPAGLSMPETLLGRPAATVLPWLNALAPKKRAHVMVTPTATLVGLLADGTERDVTSEERARLGIFFPELAAGKNRLSGLQRAHLWTLRLLQNEAALADLLDLDEKLALQPFGSSPAPVAHRRFEIYLFSSAKEHQAFCRHIFPAGTDGLVGARLDDVPVPVPVSAVPLEGAPAEDLRRRFVFSASLLSLTRHRRLPGGPPPWLMLGTAHFMEDGLPRASGVKDRSLVLGASGEEWSDRRRFVRDLIVGGSSADIITLGLTGYASMTPALRLQAASMVRFMAGAGVRRFARLMNVLYTSSPDDPRVQAMGIAVRAAYGVDPGTLEAAWQAWAADQK